MLRFTTKLISPLVLAASPAIVIFTSIFIGSLPRTALGSSCCDFLPIFVAFAIGIPIFVLLSVSLVRFEQLRSPRVRDHLRRCALLYTMMASMIVVLAILFESQASGGDTSGGYISLVAIFLVVVLPIFIDAVVLYELRRGLTLSS